MTPILVSLVKKDASMLDAFGKGASEDIRRCKNTLYTQMTWDPDRNTSMFAGLPKLAIPQQQAQSSLPPSPQGTAK